LKLLVGIAEADGANAFVGGGDEHASEGRIGGGVADDGGYGSASILIWGHAELGGGALIEAAAGAVSGGVEGGGDGVSGLQILFDLAKAAGVDVGPGRDAERGFEGTLEMERAAAKFFG